MIGLPLPLRILEAARGHTALGVRYEELHRRDPLFMGGEAYRFTGSVTAGWGDARRVVAIEGQLSAETLDAMPPSVREAVIEREWRDLRERMLSALLDPTSAAVRELRGGE